MNQCTCALSVANCTYHTKVVNLKPQHTPTPWKIDLHSALRIQTKDGMTVASVGNDSTLREQWEANAAFIVRAVNSHEKLIEAMREAMEYLRNGDGEDRFMSDAEVSAIQTLEEAIAKAEQK